MDDGANLELRVINMIKPGSSHRHWSIEANGVIGLISTERLFRKVEGDHYFSDNGNKRVKVFSGGVERKGHCEFDLCDEKEFPFECLMLHVYIGGSYDNRYVLLRKQVQAESEGGLPRHRRIGCGSLDKEESLDKIVSQNRPELMRQDFILV